MKTWKELLVRVPVEIGVSQGYFRYYREDQTYDEVIAVHGKLYKNNKELLIEGLSSFQTEKPIEAVQFRNKLWIATGTKLVAYDGESAKVVEAYKPQPLEALYIGLNGLADNPDQFMKDGEATFLRVDGITVDKQYGEVNTNSTFTAYVSKPTGSVIEYKWEWRLVGDLEWTPAGAHPDFEAGRKQYVFWAGGSTGDYEIRVLARIQGETITEEYYIPKYTIFATDENKKDQPVNMHKCNRILLHWNRLLLYGDPEQPDIVYISHLNEPSYFPMGYNIQFENEKREEISTLVQFRDSLIVFMKTSIQALFGKAPIGEDTYRRVVISNSIGCIAPETAKVMGNYVTFLARDGIHILKTLSFSEDRMNVQKIDVAIDNIVPRHSDACAIVSDGQYHIVFPREKKRLRFYYDLGRVSVWTKDESERLDFVRMYEWDGEIYGVSSADGYVRRFDPTVWDDDGYVYEDYVKFKDFDFGMPYNPKKLKELQLVLAHHRVPVNLMVYVYADAALIVTPNKSHTVIEGGEVKWKEVIEPNLEILPGTILGTWQMSKDTFSLATDQVHKLKIAGKCRRTRVEIRHKESTPHQLYGLAYIYKLKDA